MSGVMQVLLAGGGFVQLTNQSVTAWKFSSGSAIAEYGLDNDGTAYTQENSGASVDIPGEWWSKGSTSGLGASYEVRATETSGTVSGGTVGTWQSLSSARAWWVTRSTAGSKTCTLTIEVRNATTLVVLDSCSVTLTAEFEV